MTPPPKKRPPKKLYATFCQSDEKLHGIGARALAEQFMTRACDDLFVYVLAPAKKGRKKS